MFSNTDDDDLFNVTPNTTGSNLASLFNTSLTLKQNDNTSLVYTAPKNPKSLNAEETPKSKSALQSSVICTAFVDAFSIWSDNNQTLHGKCGLAVIGNHNLKTYDIIIYKSKQDIIMRKQLKPDFTFSLQNDNFASFYDDQKQQWTVHFESSKDINNFVDEIHKCGAQVLNNVRKDSAVEPESNETMNFKASDAASDSSTNHTKANILSRMAKMGQSMLPTINSMKPEARASITDSETDESEVIKKPTVKKRHKIVSGNGDALTKTNNQSITAPEYVIVNGQLLPVSSVQSTVSMIPSSAHSQLLLPNQLVVNPPQLTVLSDPLNIFIAENRTHNCELRMNITHLSSKLDSILAQVAQSSTNTRSEHINELQIIIDEKDKEIAERIQSYNIMQTQNDTLSKNNSSYQELISDYAKQIEKQNQELSDQNDQMQEFTVKLNELPLLREQHLQTIDSLNAAIDSLKAEICTINNSNNTDAEIEKLNNSIKNLQDDISNRNGKVNLFEQTLKQSMNFLYQEIMQNFEEEASYSGNKIRAIISQKLKMSTLSIIQEFNNNFKETSKNVDHNSDMPSHIKQL